MAVLNPTLRLRPYSYLDKSWCNCSDDVSCKNLGDRLQCKCGEEWAIFEWNWEDDSTAHNVELSNDNRDVVFHPVYSSGTAAVRGKQPLKQNVHYYWEIKMLTNLYGTDIMVGVGTSKVVLSDWKLRFCSMLGYDSESWGYSYTGKIQHDKTSYNYGSRFSVGSLIGVHVDMCAGTLEYYLNRKPLGIAFRGLKNYELYPMVSSTAAQSAMRITCALSEASTLQLDCLKLIINNQDLLKKFWSIPGLDKMIGKKYFWIIPKPPKPEKPKLALEDEVVLPLSSLNRNFALCKRRCTGLQQVVDSRADPDHISYRQYHIKDNLNKTGFEYRITYNNKIINKYAKAGFYDDSQPGCSSVGQQTVNHTDDSDQSNQNHISSSVVKEIYDTEEEDSDLDD